MNGAPRIALATYERAPELTPDDRLLIPAFAALGAEAVPAVWTDPAVDWSVFDAVMIRSCWDYHLRSLEFHRWLDRVEAAGCELWNSAPAIRWNSDKRYLIELARRGVRTVPTHLVPRGEPELVRATVLREGWQRFVLKPAVSASGYETHRFAAPFDEASLAIIDRVVAVGDTLVQPFLAEVERDGEHSFVFFDGVFSHAAIKRAAAGEFRVQTEHGGTVEPCEVDPTLVQRAADVLDALPQTPLYARVDGVAVGGGFELMELELIEPNLFLDFVEGAAARLAAAALTRLASR